MSLSRGILRSRRRPLIVLATGGLALALAVPAAVGSATRHVGPDQPPLRFTHVSRPMPYHGQFEDVSCPTKNFCAAVDRSGNAVIEHNGRWMQPVRLHGAARLGMKAVSCVSATYCAAIDNNFAYHYNGQRWKIGKWLGGLSFPFLGDQISCPTVTRCYLSGGTQKIISEHNGHWSVSKPIGSPHASLAPISCPTANFCMTGDQHGDLYVLRHGQWGKATKVFHRLADREPFVAGLSCSSPSFCVADDEQRTSTWNGHSWSAATHAAIGEGSFTGPLSCVSNDTCVGIAGQGIARFANGSWTGEGGGTVRSDNDFVSNSSAVSCATAHGCIAVTAGGASFAGTERRLRPLPSTDVNVNATALSCASGRFCFVGDSDGKVRRYQRGHWGPRYRIDSRGLVDTSCAGPSFCASDDVQGRVTMYNGKRWTKPALPGTIVPPYNDPGVITCPAVGTCLTVDARAFLQFAGGTWTTTDNVVKGQFEDLSCPTTSFCVASDYHGQLLIWNGSTWSTPHAFAPPHLDYDQGETVSVSCSSPSFCVADYDLRQDSQHAELSEWNGHRWSAPERTAYLGTATCPATGLCVFNDFSSIHFLVKGRIIGPYGVDFAPTTISTVTCPSPKVCAILDNHSKVIFGTPKQKP